MFQNENWPVKQTFGENMSNTRHEGERLARVCWS